MLRKQPEALQFARAVGLGERDISVVSYLEILRGCRDRREEADLAELVEEWFTEVVPLTPEISASSVSLMEQFALSRRPGVDDMLIAATALRRKETLATGNVRHFDFIPGLLLKPFHPSKFRKER